MTPVELVQRQLEAYNAHDIDAFCACYAEDVRTWRIPSTEPALDGMAQFRDYYIHHRFNNKSLRVELVNRMAFGNKVIDHEYVYGMGPEKAEVAVVFEVIDGLIRQMWVHSPN